MQTPLEIGVGQADITPAPGCPLSGFIARRGLPSETVDAPLTVTVLALREPPAPCALLVNYTLLLLDAALAARVKAALARSMGPLFAPERCVLVTVHTHSGPPTSPLEGEDPPDPAYLDRLVSQTVQAAHAALAALAPAELHYAAVRVPGLTYNRRAVLADGRVSINLEPDAAVLERGPVDDTLTALAWRDPQGRTLAVILHFACHAAATCTLGISADIPGELMRRSGALFGAPCLYLQGATGDINPLTVASTRERMLEWCERAWTHLADLPAQLRPLRSTPFTIASTGLPLALQPFPPRATLEARIAALERIAGGDFESPEIQPALTAFADLMNFKPGEKPDPVITTFMASALAGSERNILAAVDQPQPAPELALSVWSFGQVALAFLAAEVFAVTGFKIRALGAGQAVLPVSYAAPTIGYLPDREAMRKGGYEAAEAWRFYRQPAPFAPDSEERAVATLRELLRQTKAG
jgi:hypothetical protein